MYTGYLWRFQAKSDRNFLAIVQAVIEESEIFYSFLWGWGFHCKQDLYERTQLAG
jgi:hypothetical protein